MTVQVALGPLSATKTDNPALTDADKAPSSLPPLRQSPSCLWSHLTLEGGGTDVPSAL